MANFFEFLCLEAAHGKITGETTRLPVPCAAALSFAKSVSAIPTVRNGPCAASISSSGRARRLRWWATMARQDPLIKLLSRLYDPTEGSILIDGIDIRDLDPLELAQENRRDLSRLRALSPAGVRENIGFGQIDADGRISNGLLRRLERAAPMQWSRTAGKL